MPWPDFGAHVASEERGVSRPVQTRYRRRGDDRARAGAPIDPDSCELDEYLLAVSGGHVVGRRPSGPVFGTLQARRYSRYTSWTVAALPPRSQLAVALLSTGWLISLGGFWWWWLLPENRVSTLGIVLNSLLVLYTTALPAYFVLAANRMRVTSRNLGIPRLNVAMVVTKAPSEPWPMVRNTLDAMLAQAYPDPFDVWLADENPDDETRSWCEANSVKISTRFGNDRYLREEWPRRRRCKEGNLTYFYEHFGYANYDIVSQLDADHVPQPGYLAEMIRPFADPSVGYVGAPSICDANRSASWTVRGRLYEEALFHGAQQLGAVIQGTPSCIGSHYAVRTSALREIGTIGPELAEDFSTSYLLNVAGWRGAFAIEAEAHGDGPRTFASMVTQEFQWSRSLTSLWLGLYPRTARRLPWPLALEFAFRCGFDLLIATIMVAGVALFSISCLTGVPWVSVNLVYFLALTGLLSVWLLGLKAVIRSQGLCRPIDAPLISWEGALYLSTRWPYIVIGVIAALSAPFVSTKVDFKVTPKGDSGPERLPAILVAPFFVVSMILTLCAWAGLAHPQVIGYVALALFSAVLNASLALIVSVLHARDTKHSAGLSSNQAFALVRTPIAAAILTAGPALALTATNFPQLLQVVFP